MNWCINKIQPNDLSHFLPPAGSNPVPSGRKGSRFYEEIRFESGYGMVMAGHTRSQGMRMPFDLDQAPVSFCYNLAQRARCTVTKGGQAKRTLERRAGDGVVSYLPHTRGILESPRGANVLGISLYFPLEIFKDMFGITERLLEPFRAGPGGGPQKQAFYHQAKFAHDTRLALWQMLQCPYGGKVRKLFMEAKSLELVALKLAEMSPARRCAAPALGKRALDQVREAYQILLESMADPPSLIQLSRMVGLNRNKLNSGFKKLYGDTVFNVLRKARLTKACSLLQNTEMSLVEIAFSIGYRSQANFTTAFRQHFGQLPKNVRKTGWSGPEINEFP